MPWRRSRRLGRLLRLAYAECIKNGRVKCRSLKEQLEECTAKHIGKLD